MTPTPVPSPLVISIIAGVPAWVLGILLGIALVAIIRLRIWLLQRTDRAAALLQVENIEETQEGNTSEPSSQHV